MPLISLQISWMQPEPQDDMVVPAHLRGILCFRVVRRALTSWHGAKALGFHHQDNLVSAHKILLVQRDSHAIVVDGSSMTPGLKAGAEAVVMSLSLLPPQSLLRLIVMEQRCHEINYSLRTDLPENRCWNKEELAHVLRKLCEGQVQGLVRFDCESADYQNESAVLDFLTQESLAAEEVEAAGCDEGRYRYLSVTAAGSAAIAAGITLHRGPALANVRKDTPLEELMIWELFLTLHKSGWVHQVGNPRQPPAPFVPDEGGPKVWFTRPRQDTAQRNYLLLLCQGQKRVEHLKPAGYYKALLDGREWQGRAARQGLRAWPEDTLDVDPGPQRHRGRRPGPAADVGAQAGMQARPAEASLASEPEQDAGEEDHGGEQEIVEPQQDAGEEDRGGEQEIVEPEQDAGEEDHGGEQECALDTVSEEEQVAVALAVPALSTSSSDESSDSSDSSSDSASSSSSTSTSGVHREGDRVADAAAAGRSADRVANAAEGQAHEEDIA